MGCTSPNPHQITHIPPQHLRKLLQVAQLDNPLNVNKRYQHITRLQTQEQTGSGFKKTAAYHSLVTREQLRKQREQFWETRISGQPHVWAILKMAIYAVDTRTALQLLAEHKITMLGNTIQMCVDEKCVRYELPVFCINQPLSYAQDPSPQRNLVKDFTDQELQLAFRSTKFPEGDIKLKAKVSSNIQNLKATIKAQKQLSAETKVRLFYNGRELLDNHSLGNYGYKHDTVIQALIV